MVDLSITPSWLSSALKSTRARFFAARSDLKEKRLQSRKIFPLCSEPVFNIFFNRTSLCLPSPLPPALVLTLPLTLFLSALNHRPVLNYKRQTVQFQLIDNVSSKYHLFELVLERLDISKELLQRILCFVEHVILAQFCI